MKRILVMLLAIVITFQSVAKEDKEEYRDAKYRIFANLTTEGITWVGLLFCMPDSYIYRKKWFKDDFEFFQDGVKFKYTDGNSGFFTDKIVHPFMGSTIYGFLEQSGYHPLEAFGLTCAHSILWEFKEYPVTRHVEMKDAVWTMAPSAVYCLGDILVNESDIKFWRVVGYILSSPSHTGKFIYKYSLGLLENRKR